MADKVWLLMRGKPIPGRVDDVKRKTGRYEFFIKRCSTLSERLEQSNKSLDYVAPVPIFLEQCSFEVIARFWTVEDSPAKTTVSDARQPKVKRFTFFGSGFANILGLIVSIRVKTLSFTNLVASWYIKREKTPFLVDVLRSKNASA